MCGPQAGRGAAAGQLAMKEDQRRVQIHPLEAHICLQISRLSKLCDVEEAQAWSLLVSQLGRGDNLQLACCCTLGNIVRSYKLDCSIAISLPAFRWTARWQQVGRSLTLWL